MIRFDHISKLYRGTSRPALGDVSFEAQRGEFVFLVGASGSGKSSCLRLILKEERPSKGKIHVLGQDLGTISSRKVPYFRRNLGVVFQDFRLLPNKTVYQNVAFTLQVIGKSRGFIQEAVPDVLQMVGLAGKEQRMPHELSGGEQQRVAIARAVVNKPQILLADEPTGNLDPATSAGIMSVLERINAGGTTVIMATHEAAFVDQMKKRVIELSMGQIVRDERHGGYGVTAAIPLQKPQAPQQPQTVQLPTGVVVPVAAPVAEPRAAAPTPAASSVAPAAAASRPVLPRLAEPRAAEPRTVDPRTVDPRTIDPRTVDPRTAAPAAAGAAPAEASVESSEAEQAPQPPDNVRPITRATPTVHPAEMSLAERLGLRANGTDGGEYEQNVGPVK